MSLGASDPAAIITAIGAAIAAVLGGLAAVLAALGRRATGHIRNEITSANGRSIADNVQRLQADVNELTYRVGAMERAITDTGE